jgi:hypothetical protein
MKTGLFIPFEIIAPMAAGILFAMVYLVCRRGKIKRGTISRAAAEKKQIAFAQFLEAVSLKVLLPFFVVESIMRTAPGMDMVGAPIIGFSLPAACLVISALYRRKSENAGAFRFIVSTFGGGNRGTIFIIMLFGATPYFQDYVKYFSLVDLGNFAFLMLVTPWLLKRQFGTKPDYKPSILNNYLFITAVIAIGFIGIRAAVLKGWDYDIRILLEKSLSLRKHLFTALLFAAITLRVKLSWKQFIAFWGCLRSFVAVRLTCVVLLAIPAYLLFQSAGAGAAVMTLVSAIILSCMPPSSMLPSMVARAHAPQPVLTEINTVTAMFNVFYIFLLAVAIILKIALLL